MNLNILKIRSLKTFNLWVIFFYPPIIIAIFQNNISTIIDFHYTDLITFTTGSICFIFLVL